MKIDLDSFFVPLNSARLFAHERKKTFKMGTVFLCFVLSLKLLFHFRSGSTKRINENWMFSDLMCCSALLRWRDQRKRINYIEWSTGWARKNGQEGANRRLLFKFHFIDHQKWSIFSCHAISSPLQPKPFTKSFTLWNERFLNGSMNGMGWSMDGAITFVFAEIVLNHSERNASNFKWNTIYNLLRSEREI